MGVLRISISHRRHWLCALSLMAAMATRAGGEIVGDF
jgi:hypothetical protein